jgi:hypothetical protein
MKGACTISTVTKLDYTVLVGFVSRFLKTLESLDFEESRVARQNAFRYNSIHCKSQKA